MATQREIDIRGTGYLRTFNIPSIAASGTYRVPIPASDIEFITYLNAIDIVNADVVNISVRLDGNSTKNLRTLTATNKSQNDTRFRDVVIVNEDGAVATTADAITITIQKFLDKKAELGFR